MDYPITNNFKTQDYIIIYMDGTHTKTTPLITYTHAHVYTSVSDHIWTQAAEASNFMSINIKHYYIKPKTQNTTHTPSFVAYNILYISSLLYTARLSCINPSRARELLPFRLKLVWLLYELTRIR